MQAGEMGGGGGPCLLPVTVIRCILELPGEIRSFPGSRCNGELPVVCLLTCAPWLGRGRGRTARAVQQGFSEDEPAGSAF